ncbi:hypothetical protein ACFQ3Z_45920 [Streptomyces nogalater]
MSESATTSAIRDELAGYIRQGVIPPFNYAYPSRSAYRPWTVPGTSRASGPRT